MALRQSPDVRPGAIEELRDDLGLSRVELSRLLGVSLDVVEALEQRAAYPVSADVRERLGILVDIRDVGMMVFTPGGIKHFIRAPLAFYEGRSVLQLFEAGETDRAFGVLAGEYEGQGF